MTRQAVPPVRLKHLGAAGWEISAGDLTILLDPYLSRLRYRGRFGNVDAPASVSDTRPVFGPDDDLVPDTATIDAHITRADYILHSHSHFNHTLDMPYIAGRTGARVIGTESTINLARGGGVPEPQLFPVRGGEDYDFGAFSVKIASRGLIARARPRDVASVAAPSSPLGAKRSWRTSIGR